MLELETRKLYKPLSSSYNMKGLTKLIVGGAIVASAIFPGKASAQDNQINPFHQPNIVYDKLNCYGGGESNSISGIDQGDVDAAAAGTNDYRLDVTGDEQINSQDATKLQDYVNGSESKLPSWWNFLTREEKVDWLDKMLAIDKTDTITYQSGEFISGDFGAQLYLNFQGFPTTSQEEMDLIEKKYDTTTFGRYNIPVYHVAIIRPDGSGHGGAAALKGGNPLNFYDWQFIEPQQDKYNHFKNLGVNWNEDGGTKIKIRRFTDLNENDKGKPIFSAQNFIIFKIDSTGTPVLDGDPNPNLLLTEPNVATEDEKATLQDYSLGSNYPDPFNSTTNIPYEILNETEMSLDLYDNLGRQIRNIEKGFKYPGFYVETLNASNLPSGMYHAVFKTPEGIRSEKLQLVK